MKNLLLFLFCIPFFAFSQTINEVDSKGLKQGDWKKTYENGNTKYEGNFKDDIEQGLFKYYYKTEELKGIKEFFHKGKAASAHFYNKQGNLIASGLYVSHKKDSTWNYYNADEIIILSEQKCIFR